MKAVLYQKSGSAHQLTLSEVQQPVPLDDQVLVKIHAASINAADYRSMRMGLIPKSRIFGNDSAVAARMAAGSM